MKHLLTLGHRGIAVLTPCIGSQYGNRQREGVERAMREFGLTDREIRMVGSEFATVESGEELTKEVVSSFPDTTAIFVIDAPMAIGCLRAAEQLGLSVPQDLSILTAGSQWLCSIVNPALTSLTAYDEVKIARHALEKLFGQIDNPEYRKSITVLPRDNKVVFRRSVHAFRRAGIKSAL